MNLFEKAGRDSVTANAKHYAKDVRHLVMLSGFSLAESAPYPQAPLPNVGATTTTVNFASPPGLNPGFQVNPFFDRLLLPVLELIQLCNLLNSPFSCLLPNNGLQFLLLKYFTEVLSFSWNLIYLFYLFITSFFST